jgi:hypothetical protein
VLDMAKAWQPQDHQSECCPWGSPPWREIERKIGEELREHYRLPQELPHKMRTLLLQFSGKSDPVSSPAPDDQGW